MSQYKVGTCNVTNNDATVTGNLTEWSTNVSAGDKFLVIGTNVSYTVASVTSDTELELSTVYGGSSDTSASYTITSSFTPNYNLITAQKGDLGIATFFSDNFSQIDALLLQPAAGDGSASSPSYTFASDTDTGMYLSGVDAIGFSTDGTLRLEIESDGTLNVAGTTDYETLILADDDIPNKKYVDDYADTVAASTHLVPDGSASAPSYSFTNDTDTGIYLSASDTIGFAANGIEQVTISDNKITINGNLEFTPQSSVSGSNVIYVDDGTNYTASTLVYDGQLVFPSNCSFGDPGTEQGAYTYEGTSIDAMVKINHFGNDLMADLTLHRHSTTQSYGPILGFLRSHSSDDTHVIVQDGDRLGQISFSGQDGTDYNGSVFINAEIDGTPGANDMPGRLIIATSASGSNTPTERLRIESDGTLNVAGTTDYEDLVTSDDDIPNKKYVDDTASVIRPNILHNGEFRISQQGNITGAVNGDRLVDRWINTQSGSGVVNLSQSNVPDPTINGYFGVIHVTTADGSIAAGDYYFVQQRIEGNDIADLGYGTSNAVTTTLSFWHSHTKTGTYCINLRNDASDRSYVAEYTQSVSDTWEYSTITIPGDITGTWSTDNGKGILLGFVVASGSTFQTTADSWQSGSYLATSSQVNGMDSTSNNFRIGYVKFEKGSIATPYVMRTFEEELAICLRYYEKSYNYGVAVGTTTVYGSSISGTGSNSASGRSSYTFSVRKVTTPSMRYWDTAGNENRVRVDATDNITPNVGSPIADPSERGALCSLNLGITGAAVRWHWEADTGF
jgi:hypothetical protein